MGMSDDLKKEIEAGAKLAKVDEAELKKREEEKRKRLEELQRVKEALEKGD